MEEFKKKLLQRQYLILIGLFVAASSILTISRSFDIDNQAIDAEHLRDFIEGFQLGITTCLLGILLFYAAKYLAAIKNAEKLKKLYISETDERKLFILQKSGSSGMNFIMYCLAVGTAVAGNFNATVFFTLLGTCLFVVLVRAFLKIYYHFKF